MEKTNPTAPWWQRGIIYQIYPRSFADSNGDGIGDLNGITGRLDYLADLGVDALWLSPVYPSPDVDFGYDVADYVAIDPKYGSMEDFDRLVAEAHARGIHIVLDLVLNHTSDQHPWFIESRKSKDNPKRNWYLWADPSPKGGPPNNWESTFGGKGWEFDPATGQYYFHMFYKQQPDLNWHNPEVRAAIMDVFRFWLERGVDGFRLDVFNVYFKHPELLDNPPALGLIGWQRQQHVNDCDQPEMMDLVCEIRGLLDSYSQPGRERYVVGETFLSDPGKAARYCGPGCLHAAFNFEFLGQPPFYAFPFLPRPLMAAVQQWEHLLGPDTWPNYVFNNHDTVRSATRWRSFFLGSENDNRMKLAATLLLTLRGTPFMYYGEEIGMRDIKLRSKAEVLDPIGRRFWPLYKGRDGCRSPMQWDGGPNAGFAPAEARPWLPVHPDHASRNVEAQKADSGSLLNVYRKLIALRHANPALTEGMFQPVTFGTRFLMAYLRQTKEQTVLVALNFSGVKQRLMLGGELARASLMLLFSTRRDTLQKVKGTMLQLEPYEAVIVEVTSQR